MSAEQLVYHERWQSPPSSSEMRKALFDRLSRRVLVVTAALYAAGFARSLVLSRSLELPLDTVSGSFDYVVATGGMSVFQVAIQAIRLISVLPWWFNLPTVILLGALIVTAFKRYFPEKGPVPRPQGWTDADVSMHNRTKYRSEHWLTTFGVTIRLYLLFAGVVVTGILSASLMLRAVSVATSVCSAATCDTYLRVGKRPIMGIQVASSATELFIMRSGAVLSLKRGDIVAIRPRQLKRADLHGVQSIEDLGFASAH